MRRHRLISTVLLGLCLPFSNLFSGHPHAGRLPQRLSTNSGFVDFQDYFGRFSIQFAGAIYSCRYCPRKLESKIGSKEPENRQKLSLWTVSQKNEKKPIEVIEFKGDGSGLFSNLTRVMEWAYCVKHHQNFALYINLSGLYGCTDNLFSELFKEAHDPQIFATSFNGRIVYCTHRYPMIFSKFQNFAADDMLRYAKYKYVYRDSTLYTDPDFALFRNRLHPIVRKFFQPASDLQRKIDEITSKMDVCRLDDSPTVGEDNTQQKNLKIGIHVRFQLHYQDYTHSPDQFLDDIERDVDQIMASRNPQTTTIFLATLVQPLVDRLSAKYNVITCDIPRNDDPFSDWVKTPHANSLAGARSAVVDTWCLANCDELWCGSSNMAIFAACLNPNLQIHLIPSLKDYNGG